MVYLRMAWKSLCQSKFAHLLTVLQLAAALLVTAVMVSAVGLRFRKYTPFMDYYNANGYLLVYPFFMEYGEHRYQVAAKSNPNGIQYDMNAVNEELSAPLAPICPLNADFWISAPPKYKNHQSQSPQISLYTDDFLSRWVPVLAAGTWLTPDDGTDVIPAVVTWNDDEWQVGDTVTGTWKEIDENGSLKELEAVTIRIVGMLADGEAVAGQTGENTQDFRMFWRPYSYERDESVQMFLPATQTERLAPTGQYTPLLSRTILLRYTEDVSPEQMAADYKQLTWNSNSMITYSMQELRENSRAYLYSEVYKLLPVVVMLMVLVAVSSISSTALSTRKRLHDYAVFALSGLPWGKCILINAAQSLLTAGASAVLAGICGAVLQNTSLREMFYVRMGVWELLCCAALIAAYLLISLFMPYVMIHGCSTREILKSN